MLMTLDKIDDLLSPLIKLSDLFGELARCDHITGRDRQARGLERLGNPAVAGLQKAELARGGIEIAMDEKAGVGLSAIRRRRA